MELISFPCLYNKTGFHRVAVGFTCFYRIATLAQLSLPNTGTHILTLVIDIGIIIYTNRDICKEITDIRLPDVDHTRLLLVTCCDIDGFLTFIAVFCGSYNMTAIVQIFIINRCSATILAINIDI